MRLLCVDIGSTWTKGLLVDESGELLGTAQHRTTLDEVLTGIDAVVDELGGADEVLACSSAGGGLRLAVVGQEKLISAEAGYRVALSAGAKVVHNHAGKLNAAGIGRLRLSTPDVLLLVGGTDGGDDRILLHNAQRLARARFRGPIVLAGNVEAQPQALEALATTKRTVVPCANVLPELGELCADPARDALRGVFLKHVIGGKRLSRGTRFRSMVRTVTPDAVLTGVARLADRLQDTGSVLVVDVGGATTDVYSAVSTVEENRDSVALPADRRTVEGDLGMRWSARGVVAEAAAERLPCSVPAEFAEGLDPAWLPATEEEHGWEAEIAALAAVIAMRRHVRQVSARFGPQGVGLLVVSGGVYRQPGTAALGQLSARIATDPVLRPILSKATVVVDREYVLGPAGLLPAAAASTLLDRVIS
ncbi:hypothetical protein D5S17_05915 [Pseudonocardiaceae bacterium YIM PH 21723]|nr:hypothetical protein D5S17_05915 [Pseudonocardiaceae bacterium YIM PH 21723]